MDGTRQLTAEGKRQAGEMAAFMQRHVGRVDVVITSPFARAMETAGIMADALGAHVVDTTLMQPDGDPPGMWKEIVRIAQASEHVLLVGHDPSINKLLGWLIGGGSTRFEHGAIAHVKPATGEGSGMLHWFVDVKIVERDVLQDVAEAAQELVASL